MKKNFLISTGGSGGHVIPGTILYQHLSKNFNCIISSDKRGFKFLNKDIYQTETIDTPRLNNIFFLPFNLIKILFLTIKSYFLLKDRNIEKMFSTGGYMSLPIVLAARFLKLEIFLIEPNYILGRANKFFLKFCKKIFCYSKDVEKFPKNYKYKIVTIEPLVRKKIYDFSNFEKNKKKFSLLIVGGSQGASIFDNNLKYSIVNISKKIPMRVFQQTNDNNIHLLDDFYKKNNLECKIFSFDNDFSKTVCQADLCITRAGASTLAELSVLNIPFIAVPLPTSKDDHQLKNANFYKNNECCWIIEQNIFEETIEDFLKEIIDKKTDYKKKKDNLKKLNYQNNWNNVNQKILRIINEN